MVAADEVVPGASARPHGGGCGAFHSAWARRPV